MSRLSPRSFLRQLDLGTLDLYSLVCESGSIAGAAAQGQMVASAVSKRIAELENLAGAPLLTRHARGVQPTPLGQQLLRHAHAILSAAEHLRVDLDEFASGVRGHVRLCASASAVEQFLPADMAVFVRRHPDVRVELRQAASRAVAQAVREGTADLGICGESEDVLGLAVRPYRSEQLVLVVPKGHTLARLSSVDYARALDFPQIGLRESSTVGQVLAREAGLARRVLRRAIEVDSLSALCRMVENGLGLGVMPEGAYQALGKHLGLKAVALKDDWARRELNLYARDFDTLPAAAQLFVRHLHVETAR
ncbi:LysR substrate-binding domain-containing protein [Hylemonella gracilis]|uniref:Transcriptional regulator, LysR family protein n=1 Tax=Hylemonella gracilis ATCC 19624 TaxID=887062 RepID=F3KV01_9BURK|nr:LysR substrate-binding domain-containing protein [Hylemonella gracilis]EGI76377.1 transcriptional regulator, LysR family protein [Hylemonella gracilis ATCC 19624]